ncbi:uncharacterized protein LOC110460831 [Mizuhopecten yessoensis]|uniref:Uncharacterized protein n=1 Tax=Mizuhopecten yessoensis TaxID=6573 RepID=A0A210Q1J7_MIZYE|nr:uncharacterized protein LOC110460831 [Mizuhopecten yessoensis]OWF42611.1 hypothetical protein KP79_PYT10215 [Mizuhopecten yessoensis]
MAREETKWFVLLVLLVAFVLALVGFATPSWYKVSTNSTAIPTITAGFFDVCESNTCRRYLDYFNLSKYSDDLIGCIVFCVFGIFFIGLALLFTFCSVCRCDDLQGECGGCRTDRRRYLYVAWFTLIGGLLLIASVIWFYVSQIRNAGGLYGINNSISNKADYSLALVAAAGGVAIVLAVIIFLIRLQMYDYDDDEEYERRPRKRAPQPVMYMQEPPRMPRAEPPPYVVAPPSSYRYSYKGEPTYAEYGSSRRPAYHEKKKYITYGEY